MTWNRLGAKADYVYTADDGSTYSYTTDTDLAIAGLGAADAAPVVFDPENPPANYRGRFPTRAKPRVVFCQADADGARKELVAFDSTADLYSTVSRQAVTIDGEDGETTGRKGERFTF